MESKSLLLSLILISFSAFSQNIVTITSSKNSMEENESINIIASIAAPAEKDIIIDFDYSGTGKNDYDFTFNFASKRGEIVAGGNGAGSNANQLNGPTGIHVDKAGTVYVSDYVNHRVQKWEPGSNEGITVAGGNGEGTAPNQLCLPTRLFVDESNNIFVASDCGHRIQKWASGAPEGNTIAGGNGEGNLPNQLNRPYGFCFDASGNLFIADKGNHRIQKWEPGATQGITVAGGNGYGSSKSQLNNPEDVLIDNDGNILIADAMNNRIQKWVPGAVEGITVAGGKGSGPGIDQLYTPRALDFDRDGNLIIANYLNYEIVKWAINSTSGIKLINGSDLPVKFRPFDVFVDQSGNIFISDFDNNQVLKYQLAPQIIIKAGETTGTLTISGKMDGMVEEDETVNLTPVKVVNGTLNNYDAIPITLVDTYLVSFSFSASKIQENSATDVIMTASVSDVLDKDVEISFLTEGTALENVEYILSSRKITIPAGSLTGTLTISTRGLDDSESEILESIVLKVTSITTSAAAIPNTATLFLESNDAPSVSLSYSSTILREGESMDVIATLRSANDKDVIIDLEIAGTANPTTDFTTQYQTKGFVSTVAGGTYDFLTRIAARDVFVDLQGNLYVADDGKHRIQKWVPGATQGVTVAGGNGYGFNANQLDTPGGVFVDNIGNIYISDTRNSRIQKWAPGATSGITVAGGNGKGSAGNQLFTPMGIHVDQAGNIFIADNGNHRIQKWSPNSTTGITVAGGNGSGTNSNQLWFPRDVFIDNGGNLFITDYFNNRIQKFAPGATSGTTIINTRIPFGIQVDNSGNVFVSSDSDVKKWSPVQPFNGEYIGVRVAGNDYSGSIENFLSLATDLFVDKGGNIYIADYQNFRVQKYQYSPQVVIKAGETTGKLTITSINDITYEEDKTIIITPIKVTNGLFSDFSSKTITLPNEDIGPEVTLSLSAESISESLNGQVTLTATLSEISTRDVSLSFAISGTAQETVDYTLSAKTILIPAGSIKGTITISTAGKDDTIVETFESIVFTVSNITNATINSETRTLLIESDDIPKVFINTSSTSIRENQVVDIVASLEGPSCKDVVIDFALAGTAFADIDYTTQFATKGSISTIGKGLGTGASQFGYPSGVFADKNYSIYIVDGNINRIQKWLPEANEGITLIDNDKISFPSDVFIDQGGNIYVSEEGEHRVQKWALGATQGVIVAGGNGEGSNANQLNRPKGIFVDESGNVYIADELNNRIQKWTPGATSGITVAGGIDEGVNDDQLFRPYGVWVDKDGVIFISDTYNNRIQKWLPGATTGINVVGSREFGTQPDRLSYPMGLVMDEAGSIYVADQINSRVQKFLKGSNQGITICGGSFGSEPNQLHNPLDVCLDKSGNVYVADQQNHRVQKYLFAPQIIIKAGETTGKVTLSGIDDSIEEEDKSIIVTPTNIINGNLDFSSKSIGLLDDDVETGIINSHENKQILGYPNPTSGSFKINIPGKEREVSVSIRNSTGIIMTETTMQVPSDRNLNMNISNMQPGVYFISVQSEEMNYVVKVVKR